MFVRLLEGRDAGEVRDVENSAAVALLRAGRAENPYLDAPPVPIAAMKEEPLPAALSKRGKPARKSVR